jgi:hypothetical protein
VEQTDKAHVLFTALHHAREAVSLSMVLKIFLTNLHHLIHNFPVESEKQRTKLNPPAHVAPVEVLKTSGQFIHVSGPSSFRSLFDPKDEAIGEPHLFDFADILFVPIVNLDAYVYISLNYGRQEWNEAKRKRKNFNTTDGCKWGN